MLDRCNHMVEYLLFYFSSSTYFRYRHHREYNIAMTERGGFLLQNACSVFDCIVEFEQNLSYHLKARMRAKSGSLTHNTSLDLQGFYFGRELNVYFIMTYSFQST